MNHLDSVAGPLLLSEQVGLVGTVLVLILRFLLIMKQAFLVQKSWPSSFSAVFTGFALQSLFVQVHCCLCRSSCNSCHLLLRVGLLE